MTEPHHPHLAILQLPPHDVAAVGARAFTELLEWNVNLAWACLYGQVRLASAFGWPDATPALDAIVRSWQEAASVGDRVLDAIEPDVDVSTRPSLDDLGGAQAGELRQKAKITG